MITKEQVRTVVYNAIESLNSSSGTFLLPEGNTVLMGCGSDLDSIDFVTLIVDIEDRLQDNYGVVINITAEKAMSQKNSPFKTVDSLTDYIVELI